MSKKVEKVPGDYCLFAIPDPVPPEGEKCKHDTSHGQWVVKWGDKFYSISPSTQLQKDFWIDSAKQTIGQEAAINALRWYCRDCGNIQMP